MGTPNDMDTAHLHLVAVYTRIGQRLRRPKAGVYVCGYVCACVIMHGAARFEWTWLHGCKIAMYERTW
jgi:hypothetical protein